MKKILRLYPIVYLLLFFLASCVQYIRVNTTIDYQTLESSNPEIIESKSYREIRPNIRSVLITVPKEFYEAKILLDTKEAEKTGALLKGDYSIWLSEIEKVLTINGFKVMAIQNVEETTKQLQKNAQTTFSSGVDAIIQINGLEYYGLNEIGHMTKIEMQFYSSNARGDQKEKISLYETSKKEIESIGQDYIKNIKDIPIANKGMLDLKVIHAKTNEVIWYYRNNFCRILSGNNIRSVSFLVCKYAPNPYQLVEPKASFPFFLSEKKDEKSYDKATLYQYNPKTDEKEQRLKVIRMICEDFVKEFNKNI